jgi:hypothetical protein
VHMITMINVSMDEINVLQTVKTDESLYKLSI